MKNLILGVLSLIVLTACNKVDKAGQDLSSAWDNITNTVIGDPIKDYTDTIYKHSKERFSPASSAAVSTCMIKDGGMSQNDLAALVKANYDTAEKCWNMLLEYAHEDKRFYNDGSIEKEVLAEFESTKKAYAKLFTD